MPLLICCFKGSFKGSYNLTCGGTVGAFDLGKYVNGQGVKRFVGNKKALEASGQCAELTSCAAEPLTPKVTPVYFI